MKIAMTGATGNMGREIVKKISELDFEVQLTALTRNIKKAKKILKKSGMLEKITLIEGSLSDDGIAERLIDGAQIVLSVGAVIPPNSDISPLSAVRCNEIGTEKLVSAIEKADPQPGLVHISTVALYGNRNSLHPWGRVGDPLLVSPLDIYSATKLRGEFRVMNSKIEKWAVLRQSAMLHDNMLSDNVSDGLMFHTCFNAPLEWVTASDSGRLIANMLKRERNGELGFDNFWRRCFNIGGGKSNRITGYDTLNDGFKMIGGTAKDFFSPNYNAVRNFHGVWFSDGEKLNDLFDYVSQDVTQYWKHISSLHRVYSLGKIVPKGIIRSAVIKRLFKNYNSPAYWYKHDDTARLTAFFGGKQAYEELPKDWKDFPLLVEGKNEKGEPIDYERLRETPTEIDYGYDFFKADKDIDITDLKSVASAHGGELLTAEFENGDLHRPLKWKTQDGEEFTASAYSVLRAGHWYSRIYKENVWDFDRLCKKDRLFAQIWYDSHEKDEDFVYALDEKFNAEIYREGERK